MTLTISENWVRDRVQLRENADDVRSLALPGTYHEKVTHIGNALLSFCRLKHLDLSRNALQSLDGLQHLEMLEKLNLYYNNIATLKELYKLRHNTQLEEVDLRLNPVTKNEPDYRLFMVHMLPNLRKLDDRSIRDSERKAALMHFNTDQATELTEHPPQARQPTTDKPSIPRADYVKNMAKKSTALDDDDCEVLDLIARTGDLGRPQPITGSKASYPQARKHTLEEMRVIDQNERPNRIPDDSPSRRHTTTPYQEDAQTHTQGGHRTQYATHGYNGMDPRIGSDDEDVDHLTHASDAAIITPPRKYFPSIMAYASPPTPPTPEMPEIALGILTPSESPNRSFHETFPSSYGYEWQKTTRGTQPGTQDTTHPRQNPSQGRDKVQVQFSDNVETRLIEGHDSNLRFTDESKAYTAYTSRGHFTPHPGLSGNQPQDQQVSLSSRTNGQPNMTVEVMPSNQNIPNGSHDQYVSQSGPSRNAFSEPPPVQRSLDEMPERKEETLSSNPKQEVGLDQHQFIEKLLNVVDRYWNGSKSLHRHAKFQGQAQTLLSSFLSEATHNCRQDTDRLHEDVARFAQENVSLRGQLASQRSSSNASAKAQIDQSKLQLSLEQAQHDVNALKHQLQLSMQENQRLQEKLTSTPATEPIPQPPQPTTNVNQQVDKEMLNTLEKEVESLQRDNITLKLQLKHFTQLQELAAMLQESHKSLVTTNDHLLKELDESKLRHNEEVKQLHWSYGELKRTMELTGNSALSGSTNRGRMSGGESGVKMNGVI